MRVSTRRTVEVEAEVTVRPDGRCRPPEDPSRVDVRCWSCNFGGEDNDRYGTFQARVEMYEGLVELAETMTELSITGLWERSGKWPGGFNTMHLSRCVLHDLWFHRLISPVRVTRAGNVMSWRWVDA